MSVRTRMILAASVAGLVAAVIVLVGARMLLGTGQTEVDGEFVLDEPGVHAEPIDGLNPDRTGDLAPTTQLLDVDDAPLTLDRYRGAPLVVNVWFTNCPPCRRELADFAEVQAEVGDQVQFVGIDPDDDVATMTAFAADRGVAYDLLRDPDQEFVDAAGIAFFPTTLFVDAGGTVVHQTGALDADALRDAIAEHLLGADR